MVETYGKKEDLPLRSMNMPDIQLLPSVRRLVHSKLAQFCLESKGSDLYHMMEVIEMLRAVVPETSLQEEYKENYAEVVRKLKILNHKLNRVKLYYDSITTFDEKVKEQRLNRLFKRELSTIPLINSTIFSVFNTLINKTEIRFLPIPHECFKKMENADKKLDDEPERQERSL